MRTNPHGGLVLVIEDEMEFIAQLADRRAEQLLLGKAVERRHQLLVVVRAGRGVFGLDHFAQLGAQHWDVLGLLGIGFGCEQADETVEANHAPVGSGAPDSDIVHQAAAMNLRHRMGLAHDERRALEQHFLMVGLKRFEIDRARVTRAAEVAQQPECGIGRVKIDLERAAAALFCDPVAPIAEKDKAASDQPSQQIAHLD